MTAYLLQKRRLYYARKIYKLKSTLNEAAHETPGEQISNINHKMEYWWNQEVETAIKHKKIIQKHDWFR